MYVQIVGADRGARTTILTFASAAGEHFTPMLIHQGLNVQPNWFIDAPDPCIIRASESGYINKTLFLDYTDLFVDWLEETGKLAAGKHLILFDGHTAHTYNYRSIQAFDKAGIELLQIPAHSSHYLHPLDKNPFSCFKYWWKVCLEEHNRKVSGRTLGKDEFWSVFNRAWHRGMSPHNIRVGFMRTGVEPVDKDHRQNACSK